MKNYAGKNPIYQKWDEAGFTLDTMHLSGQGRLIYRALLQMAWYVSTRPDLPNDELQLQRRLAITSEVWAAHRVEVLEMFGVDASTGVLFHPRLRRDWNELSLYRLKQASNGKKGGRPRQDTQITEDKPTAFPPLTHGLTRREENSISNENRTDDAVPSASLGVVTPPKVESKATPTAPAPDISARVTELIAFVTSKTGFVPPSSPAVASLLGRFPLPKIRKAFEGFIATKTEKQMLGAVRTFFQGENAAGLILAADQAHWKEDLEFISTKYSEYDLTTVDEFLEDYPAPTGITNADYLIREARQHQEPLCANGTLNIPPAPIASAKRSL